MLYQLTLSSLILRDAYTTQLLCFIIIHVYMKTYSFLCAIMFQCRISLFLILDVLVFQDEVNFKFDLELYHPSYFLTFFMDMSNIENSVIILTVKSIF